MGKIEGYIVCDICGRRNADDKHWGDVTVILPVDPRVWGTVCYGCSGKVVGYVESISKIKNANAKKVELN